MTGPRTTLTGIRPSLWARCPTAAVFQGRGEPEAEHAPEVEQYFFRGHVFEEIVMRQIIAKHGADNVERQVVIPIPGIGEGHADGYLRKEKTLIEIKSTTTPYPSADTFAYAVRQLRIYLAYHGEAEQGALYMLNPNVMKPADIYTVKLTDADRDEIADEISYIIFATDEQGPELADHGHERLRPCTKPSQARGRMCPFAATCFAGWEPPAPHEIDDPSVLKAASELAALVEEERQHNAAVKALEETKKALKAELADVLPEKGETVVGPFLLRTWPVKPRVSVSAKALEAAGIDPYLYSTVGEARQEVRIEKAETAGDIDYGDAPW